MKSFLKTLQSLWNRLPDHLRRVLHTAWQLAIPVFLTHLWLARSSKDVQTAFIAGGAVFLASVKAAWLAYIGEAH